MRWVLLKATVIASLLVAFGQVGEPSATTEDTVELTMSNFRYCATPTCAPDDQGYVRLSSGPVAGADNPSAIIDVPEGSRVTWVYRDSGPGSCDSFGDECPGHDVRFEDGTREDGLRGRPQRSHLRHSQDLAGGRHPRPLLLQRQQPLPDRADRDPPCRCASRRHRIRAACESTNGAAPPRV